MRIVMWDDVSVGIVKELTSSYFKDTVHCSVLTTSIQNKV